MMMLSLGLNKLQKLNTEYCQPKHEISIGGFDTPKNNLWLEQSAYTQEGYNFEGTDERNKGYKLYRNDIIKVKFRDYTKIIGIILKITHLFNINIYCLR